MFVPRSRIGRPISSLNSGAVVTAARLGCLALMSLTPLVLASLAIGSPSSIPAIRSTSGFGMAHQKAPDGATAPDSVTGFQVPPLTRIEEQGAPALYTMTLPNGLTVVIDARPGRRTVYSEIGVRVGSR